MFISFAQALTKCCTKLFLLVWKLCSNCREKRGAKFLPLRSSSSISRETIDPKTYTTASAQHRKKYQAGFFKHNRELWLGIECNITFYNKNLQSACSADKISNIK